MKRSRFLFFATISLCAFAPGGDALKRLSDAVNTVQNDDAVKQGLLSVCVMRVDSGQVLFENNSSKCMMPASTMKILTTGAALGLLGADYHFETTLEADQYDSTTGRIRGDLYIRGSGDPSLESEWFRTKTDSALADRWAAVLKKKGIKRIDGKIVGDASLFEDDPLPPGWIWGDIGNYYGAGAYGLNWRDNKYTLSYKTGAAGSKATLQKMEPDVPGLHVNGELTASGAKDEAYIYGAPYSDWHTITGSIPPNKTDYEVDGALPEPPLLCAQELRAALVRAGITVNDSATTVRLLIAAGKTPATNRHALYVHHSPALSDIVYYTNLKSDNLFAELLLKTLSLQRVSVADNAVGTQVVTDYWKAKGVDTKGLFMNDGSGLSRSDLLTTRIQADVLRLIRKEKWSDVFYKSLPVAGKSGSLGSLCDGTVAENNLRAKSGYITRARGYAGYVTDKKGRLLCFSVLANNYTCTPTEMKKKLETILVKIAELE